MTSASYVVLHDTKYEYEAPVGLSRQIVHLTPRQMPWQTCERSLLTVTPTPEILSVADDAFGNPLTSLLIEKDHATLEVRAQSWVTVSTREYPEDARTTPWEQVRAQLAYHAGVRLDASDLDATRYLFESMRVRNKRELALWSAECFRPGTPLLVGVRALMHRIHDELVFDPAATTVSTPVMEVFERRRGVCQDFAHLMISCLRSLGLASRYVSGYLLTRPPPGKKRLVGADASHAWVSVYLPGFGWVDADPTNAVFPQLEHVTLGWGRDYDDVIPLRGVLLGGGSHELTIRVTVAPVAEAGEVLGPLAT
ncbi:MAG: Transglutaminase-like enzyme putative cysteine protease [Labilithrix sp.]|nr:Transglutaminase-like enzyme putative cysteine protease [Labilithrix sp.]